ncbi:MAG: hypothetical protein WCA92_12705 [Terriglobales bacterium]|jgi:hypothetical protein
MIENCVNPACRVAFTHARDGRIFTVERILTGSRQQNEIYWLCGACSKSHKVVIENGRIMTAPIEVESLLGWSGHQPAFRH